MQEKYGVLGRLRRFCLNSWALDSYIVISSSLVALTILLKLWNFNPRIPITYEGDGLLMLDAFRNFQFDSWYFSSDLVGYPFGQNLQDFPAIADGFCLTLSWILVKLFRDPNLAFNIFYLSTYPLSALGGYFGSRLIGLKRFTSIAIGVLFTFLPFHSLHGAGHTYLVMYPILPIVIGMIFREIQQAESLLTPKSWRQALVESRTFILLGIGAAVSGLYFAFFSLILFVVGSVLIITKGESLRKTWRLIVGFTVTILFLVLQAIPVLWFQHQRGPNLSVAGRTKAEVEYYSLRLFDLIRPIPNHLVDFLSDYSQNNISAYIPGEATVSLGFLGALGIGFLLIGVVTPTSPWFKSTGLSTLSKIFILLILMASLGGFNQVLASFGFTQIRVWSRMSIVIGFLALIAIGFGFEKIINRFDIKPITTGLLISSITILGIADTNRVVDGDTYQRISSEWHNDAELVSSLELRFGQGARVLQLPILRFPEQGTVNQLTDYAQLRGYLHSDTLCWSYGVVIGRDQDRTSRWQNLGINELIAEAQKQGFDALWLELRGYVENGIETETQLRTILGPPLLQDDKRAVLIFDLRDSKIKSREVCH
jgi:phosphoglycerol transferase